jgi:uncharacterized membrane protein YccF (DUF307 family)
VFSLSNAGRSISDLHWSPIHNSILDGSVFLQSLCFSYLFFVRGSFIQTSSRHQKAKFVMLIPSDQVLVFLLGVLFLCQAQGYSLTTCNIDGSFIVVTVPAGSNVQISMSTATGYYYYMITSVNFGSKTSGDKVLAQDSFYSNGQVSNTGQFCSSINVNNYVISGTTPIYKLYCNNYFYSCTIFYRIDGYSYSPIDGGSSGGSGGSVGAVAVSALASSDGTLWVILSFLPVVIGVGLGLISPAIDLFVQGKRGRSQRTLVLIYTGNFFWILLGGWWCWFLYFIMALIMALTIVLIPFSVKILKLSLLVLLPFGRNLEDDEIDSKESQKYSTAANVVWIFVGGIFLCIQHLFLAILFLLTFVFIPIGLKHLQLAKNVLLPFGKTVRIVEEEMQFLGNRKTAGGGGNTVQATRVFSTSTA